MSPSLERGREEYIDNRDRLIYGRISRRDTGDIGIVMLSRESCSLWSPGESRSDSGILIGSHRHAVGSSAEEESIYRPSLDNIVTDWMRRVRIVHRISRKTPMISDSMSERFEMGFYYFFMSVSSMIGTEREVHDFYILSFIV
jgi:hypothetical protein